jgi:hypothetical protein
MTARKKRPARPPRPVLAPEYTIEVRDGRNRPRLLATVRAPDAETAFYNIASLHLQGMTKWALLTAEPGRPGERGQAAPAGGHAPAGPPEEYTIDIRDDAHTPFFTATVTATSLAAAVVTMYSADYLTDLKAWAFLRPAGTPEVDQYVADLHAAGQGPPSLPG